MLMPLIQKSNPTHSPTMLGLRVPPTQNRRPWFDYLGYMTMPGDILGHDCISVPAPAARQRLTELPMPKSPKVLLDLRIWRAGPYATRRQIAPEVAPL